MYKRAIEANPKNAISLGNYANFLTDIRKDHESAEAMYKRAIEIDPKSANMLGNYARLLFSAGRVKEGLANLEAAIANLSEDDTTPTLPEECLMYAHCCGPPEKRTEALTRLKTLLLQTDIRTGEWDFSGVIDQAKRMNHPEAEWLEKLAKVLSGQAMPATLDDWAAWKNVGPKEGFGVDGVQSLITRRDA
jgi:tetratricopeptide (TPR) repeat protein